MNIGFSSVAPVKQVSEFNTNLLIQLDCIHLGVLATMKVNVNHEKRLDLVPDLVEDMQMFLSFVAPHRSAHYAILSRYSLLVCCCWMLLTPVVEQS